MSYFAPAKCNSHCADCGALLDAFGTCPQADPRDAARMSKPVNCGRKQPLGGAYLSTDEPSVATLIRMNEKH